MAERSSALDSSSGVARMWVRILAWLVAALVSLSKTLNHNCFILRMGRKLCNARKRTQYTLIVKEKGLAPVFLDSRLEHPPGWICARYKSYHYYYYYYIHTRVRSLPHVTIVELYWVVLMAVLCGPVCTGSVWGSRACFCESWLDRFAEVANLYCSYCSWIFITMLHSLLYFACTNSVNYENGLYSNALTVPNRGTCMLCGKQVLKYRVLNNNSSIGVPNDHRKHIWCFNYRHQRTRTQWVPVKVSLDCRDKLPHSSYRLKTGWFKKNSFLFMTTEFGGIAV